ncbi:MAG: HPr(Ser) kinase/phosphatase [Defluviitaleaceae bacterium]|nr:HPr(Ser) kinase/phosphatase [Defluviitaleaceae bacterium]
MSGLAASGAFNKPGCGYSVALSSIVSEFNLEIMTPTVDISSKILTQVNINRPALQLAGFFDYFDADRLQIIGMVEHTYLQKLSIEARQENLRRIFKRGIPAIIHCRKLSVFPEMLDYAQEYDVPILTTEATTTDFVADLIGWMKTQLAPRITMHGCLLDIYGVGTLITGDSGVGKSETALELIKRGHRFIADDAVEVRRVSSTTLVGSCPPNIRYFLELRGIGIIDILKMFGVQSIKPTQSIDLIINLELWDQSRTYDRLGQVEEFTEILGNSVSSHSIPIRPGRSLAIICESAAINHRQKKMGYNAADALTERVMNLVAGGEYEHM